MIFLEKERFLQENFLIWLYSFVSLSYNPQYCGSAATSCDGISKNFIDQPFPLKRDIVSDFRCFHPSHTSSDRKLRRCESATRNDVEANQSLFMAFNGDQDDEFSEATCLDYCRDSSIPLRSG